MIEAVFFAVGTLFGISAISVTTIAVGLRWLGGWAILDKEFT